MSYFEGQGVNWSQHRRQQSWDQSQNGASNGAGPQRDDNPAFGSQFEEVARASDNLTKGSKAFGGDRRESMPPGAFSRQFPEYSSAGVQRHAGNEFDAIRPSSSSSLSGYLASQRFGPRPSEAEQIMQVKRRAAAQRERELRNYHQEQQYNRHLSGAKSERSMSPSAMSEEDRRELIARQHRALYGNDSSLYLSDAPPSRPLSQDARVSGAGSAQGPATGSFDQFVISAATSADNGQSLPSNSEIRSRADSTASPSPNPNSFAMFDGVQQPSRASTSSPGGSSPPRQGMKPGASNNVAPIGTRPAQVTGAIKRNTPPMSSPLSYGFNNEKINAERSASSASNPSSVGPDKGVGLGWGATSGGWSATKNTLGVQASVWG